MSSTEDEDYVYFFFREAAVEYINCGKVCNIFFPSDENNDDDDVDRAICRLCTISPITELSPFRRINNRRRKKKTYLLLRPSSQLSYILRVLLLRLTL